MVLLVCVVVSMEIRTKQLCKCVYNTYEYNRNVALFDEGNKRVHFLRVRRWMNNKKPLCLIHLHWGWMEATQALAFSSKQYSPVHSLVSCQEERETCFLKCRTKTYKEMTDTSILNTNSYYPKASLLTFSVNWSFFW